MDQLHVVFVERERSRIHRESTESANSSYLPTLRVMNRIQSVRFFEPSLRRRHLHVDGPMDSNHNTPRRLCRVAYRERRHPLPSCCNADAGSGPTLSSFATPNFGSY